jgi:hypothetical protein
MYKTIYSKDIECSLGHTEGVIFDGLYDIFEEDFRSEGMAMVNDGFVVWAVPAVHC